VVGLRSLDESKWLGFEKKKMMGNSSIIARDPDPKKALDLR
jgi:hypothetical protein